MAQVQAIGVSRGGRTSKLHALTDGAGRPLRFLLTPGNAADARVALQLLDGLPARAIVLADKAYDGDAIRTLIEDRALFPIFHPSQSTVEELLLQGPVSRS